MFNWIRSRCSDDRLNTDDFSDADRPVVIYDEDMEFWSVGFNDSRPRSYHEQ